MWGASEISGRVRARDAGAFGGNRTWYPPGGGAYPCRHIEGRLIIRFGRAGRTVQRRWLRGSLGGASRGEESVRTCGVHMRTGKGAHRGIGTAAQSERHVRHAAPPRLRGHAASAAGGKVSAKSRHPTSTEAAPSAWAHPVLLPRRWQRSPLSSPPHRLLCNYVLHERAQGAGRREMKPGPRTAPRAQARPHSPATLRTVQGPHTAAATAQKRSSPILCS